MHTLRGWQKQQNPAWRALVWRVALSAVALTLCGAFALWLQLPYHRPVVQVLVVAPTDQKVTRTPRAITPDSLADGARLERTEDLAGLLSQANGRTLLTQVAQHLPAAHVQLPGQHVREQASWLAKSFPQSPQRPTTLVIYLTGVLSLENAQPALCDESQAALYGGDELLILPFVAALQHLPCHLVMLVIDAVAPTTAAPSIMAAPLIAEELAEHVEQQLAHDNGTTPLAVCIQLHAANDDSVFHERTTPLASALIDALRAEAHRGSFDASRFKDQVDQATLRSNHSALLWLTSLHWPVVTESIPLPHRELTGPPDAQDANRAHNQSASSEQLAATGSSVTPDTPRLLDLGRQALQAFERHDDGHEQTTLPAWLPLPQPLTIRQRHPGLIANLQRLLNERATVALLSGQDHDRACLQELVEQLTARPSKELANTTSFDIHAGLTQVRHERQFEPTASALINLALAQLGALDPAAAIQSRRALQQLTRAIDHSADAAHCLATIRTIESELNRSVLELERCRNLCSASLPWPTLQRALRLQLVGAQARVGLFQAHPSVQTQLHQAEQLFREARAEIDLRPDSHPDAQLDLLLDRSLGHYHAAIQLMNDALAQWLHHLSVLSEFAVRPTWTEVTAQGRSPHAAMLQYADYWKNRQAACDLIVSLTRWPDNRVSEPNLADDEAAIAQCLQETQQLLAQPTLARPAQIAALRQLNHRLQIVFERQSSQGDAWYPLRTQSPWYHAHLKQLVESNLSATTDQLQSATVAEQTELMQWMTTWKQLASELQHLGISINLPSDSDWTLNVDAPSSIDLCGARSVALPCLVTHSTLASDAPQLVADYDDQALSLSLEDRPLHSGQSLNLAELAKMKRHLVTTTQPDQTESQLVFTVKPIDQRLAKEPIVLFVSHGQLQRRAVIHVQRPPASMFDVQLIPADSNQPEEQGGSAQPYCLLNPNRTETWSLRVNQHSPSPVQVSVRAWVTCQPVDQILAQLPVGMLDEATGAEWLSMQPTLVLLGQSANVQVDINIQQTIPLLPAATSAEFKQHPRACTGLLIGLTDLHTKRVQFEYRSFRLRHPSDYVHAQYAIEKDRQAILINTSLRRHDRTHAVTAQHRVLEWPAGLLLSQTPLQLSPAFPSRGQWVSSARSNSNQLVVITDIDGWPASQAQLIDHAQKNLIDQVIGQVQLNTPLRDGVLPKNEQSVAVDVHAWSSLSPSGSQVELQIGWDRNLDRTHNGETAEQSTCLQALKAVCRGVAETGAIILESRVEPLRFVFSTAGLSNQRASLLATLNYQGQLLAQTSLPIVIDHQSPIVRHVLVEGGAQLVHGPPVTVRVTADDQGLSGIASVTAGWSLDGRLQLEEGMPTVSGVLRSDGSWSINLPTASLPPGENNLLVRAWDRAGNASETYALNVALPSAADVAALEARQTSLISGSLLFVRQPQGGLHVELARTEPAENNEPSAAPAKDPESHLIATTTSLADGRFEFSQVPSGQYLLRVRGIVRGMRVNETRQLTVTAPHSNSAIIWRLDKQP